MSPQIASIASLVLMCIELFILLGITVYGWSLLYSSLNGAPYVPTSKKQLDKILEKAHLKKGSRLVELGSGDGRLIRLAVKKYGVHGVGIEINQVLVWWARFLSKLDGTGSNIQYIRKSVFDYPLDSVDYLYIFLMPDLLKKLFPKFQKELKKGSIVISHGFKIVGFEKFLFHTEQEKVFSTFYYKI